MAPRRVSRGSVQAARNTAPRAPRFRPGLERPETIKMEELEDVMMVNLYELVNYAIFSSFFVFVV